MKLTPEKKQTFCEILSEGSSVTAAAKGIDIRTETAYQWRKDDPDFAAAWDSALESGTDLLEDEAKRRALKVSDTLLIFLLKGRRPGKFRENVRQELVGSSGGPLEIKYVNDWRPSDNPSPESSSGSSSNKT